MEKKKFKLKLSGEDVAIIILVIGCVVAATLFGIVFFKALTTPPPDGSTEVVQQEREHMYWKTIEVEVTSSSYKYWYASGCHYRASVSVYSEEYGLSRTFDFNGSDAIKFKDVDKGDMIEAKLYSWVYDSTGEVTRREIHSIEP